MGDRVGPQIEEELPAEITAPDGEPEDPPAEYMKLAPSIKHDWPRDKRCPICLGLWSPFPCPYDLSVING